MARINDIFSQALDANGSPLSGGKLYFYDSGTSTPKSTYSDEDLTTPNANPVILDAAGVPGDIFYSGSAKIVLKDADDVQLRVLDPVDACCASEGGGGGGGDWNYVLPEKTADFAAVAGSMYFVDLTADDVIATLPDSPSVGDRVGLIISTPTAPYGNYMTIEPGAKNISGYDPSKVIALPFQYGTGDDAWFKLGVQLIYVSEASGWAAFADNSKLEKEEE